MLHIICGDRSINKKIMNNSSLPAQNHPTLETRQGLCVKYVMPQGWRVTEDSQFALALSAPDNAAISFVGGHFSYPQQEIYSVENYIHDVIASRHHQELQIERLAQSRINWDWECDFTCVINGSPWRGTARCSSQRGRPGMSALLLNYGATEISQWDSYAAWLPQVAAQVELTNPTAFGVSEIMQEQLQSYGYDDDDDYRSAGVALANGKD
jgi:hypothetical protein